MQKNIKYFNKTGKVLERVGFDYAKAYAAKQLPECLADLLVIEFITGLNPDGTDRMVITWA